MGRKNKAVENGLVELIVDAWDGGKKTIVYVTDQVNEYLQNNGYKLTLSRESIRRVIRSHEEAVEDAKKSIEAAKAMAQILKDCPGTEASEAMLMQISSLIAKDMRSIDSLEFDDPVQLCHSAARIAESQLKLSNARMKAIAALDKAKKELKAEIQKEIQTDPDLLERLIKIIDNAKVK